MSLQSKGASVKLFLMGDAVGCARKNQQTPNGFYIEGVEQGNMSLLGDWTLEADSLGLRSRTRD